MFTRMSLMELCVVAVIVALMLYPTLIRTNDDTRIRTNRTVQARTAKFPHSEAFWPLTIFAFVALVAFTTTIIVVSLISQ